MVEGNAVTVDGQTILQVKDYNGRTLTMGKIAFDVHTSTLKRQGCSGGNI